MFLHLRSDVAEILMRAAALGAQSWNAADRTFEVVVSAGTSVERRDARGAYSERIDVNQDWSGLVGAPVLNAHQRSDIKNILGSVIAVRVAAGQVLATIRMSKSAEGEAAVQAAIEGHLRGVSFGYRIEATKETTEAGKRVVTVTRLTPVELSLTPIGADPAAVIRGSTMENDTHTQTQQTDPPAAADTTAALFDRAAANVEIRSIAHLSGLPQTWIDQTIDTGLSVEAARASAFEAMKVRSAAASSIRVATASVGGFDASDPTYRRTAISDAIYSRMSGTAPSEAAKPFADLTLVEIAKDCLRVRGLSTTGSPGSVTERAFFETTSDLPAIMASTVNRTMRAAYQAAPSGLKRVSRQTTAKDFRSKYRIQLSAAPMLLPINEDGEFHSGGMTDQQETYKVSTFGRTLGFSRQAFVNDDLGALNDLTRRMGIGRCPA